MSAYLLASHDPRDPEGRARSKRLRERAAAAGMRLRDLSPACWLGLPNTRPPGLLGVGPWILIGDVFNREPGSRLTSEPADADGFDHKMMGRLWGRYVGVQTLGPGGALSALLRDPSGALECIVWRQDGLTVAASDAFDWMIDALRPAWRIDYRRLAQALRDPLQSTAPPPLDGVVTVAPGTLQPLPLDRPAEILWRPADHVRAGAARALTPDQAARLLRSAVDEAVCAFSRRSADLAAEVSGGLDSSLVAASLVAQRQAPLRLWLNGYGETPQSDERRWVAALAETLDIPVTSVPLSAPAVSLAALEEVSGDWRPGLNALDTHHDRLWAERVRTAGATALMTGKGGDSVLVQTATTDVFTDRWLQDGWRSVLSPDVRALARLGETSVWSMIAEARRYGRSGPKPFLRDEGLLAPIDQTVGVHPWLAGCEAFGPAKRLQVAGVTDNVSRHAPSLQTRAIDVLNPLCSQPVMEVCLAIPTPLMTFGGRDRGLARHAFADRLPRLIAERRSKGNLTRHYGRMVLDSLAVLRPWILEGRLMAEGLLDRTATETLLTRESLMWRGHYAEIMVAAAFEAWVRVWERRLSPSRPPPLTAAAQGSRPAS